MLRNATKQTLYDSLFKRWTTNGEKNDTIVNLIKYLYMLDDYNPVLLHQYDFRTKVRSKVIEEIRNLFKPAIKFES